MLEFEHVTLTRPGPSGPVPVLRDVSFRTPPGKVYAILGPSGAGKSSLLRLACRLDDPDEGRISLDGRDVREMDVIGLRRQVGFVFQEPVLFGGSVRENLEFAADPTRGGGPLEDAEARIARVGLDPALLDRKPDALSAGQRQRIALARALVPEPRVLLLDEPTSALDPQAVTGILRLVRELRDELRLTVVMVTHVVEHARDVADCVLVLKAGRVLEEGGSHILDSPAREETRAFLAGEEE